MTRTTLVLAFSLAASYAAAQPSNLLRPVGPSGGRGAARAAAPAPAPDEVGTRRSLRASLALDSVVPASVPVKSASDVAPSLVLNLFPDATFAAELDRLDVNPDDGYSWVGHVGEAKNTVFLAVRNGEMAGNISVDGTDYQIRPNGDGTHTVREVDLSQLPPEHEPVPAFPDPYADGDADADVAAPGSGISADAGAASADSGSTIDIMVVYTTAARVEYGGVNGINALADLAITETNTSYANSGITQRLRLVHTAEVGYAETGNIGNDLDALTYTNDGQMDSVHGLRNTYGADAVVLFVKDGGAYCGIAWVMYTVSPSLQDSAFSVVDTSCATGYYSFGHELGHNMGARHDRYVDNTDGSPFTYNHGAVNVQDQWRTVMAYNNACNAGGTYCERIPYWSNPNVSYGGDPMGVPEGQAGAADNRKTLNNTAYTFANFRQTAAPVSQPVLVVDGPADHATLTPGFTLSGWAVDRGAPSGTGIDLVRAHLFPSSGSPIFLGNATVGIPRADVGAYLGSSQYNNSGYRLNVPGPVPPGSYTLRVEARSTVSGAFTYSYRTIHVQALTRMSLDRPSNGSAVGFPFRVEGWVFNTGAPDGSGIDYIHVWAFPAGGGSPTFLGFPTLRLSRPDVGAYFGSSSYNNSGFSLRVSTLLPPGNYVVAAYAHSTVTNSFDAVRSANVAVGTRVLFVDTPQSGSTKSSPLVVAGWALDRAAVSGTGVDAVHVWAAPKNGNPAIFAGSATMGYSRPDVGAFLGNHQFDPSGYQLSTNALPPGAYTLWVYARSTATGTFNHSTSVDVTIQ